MSDLSDLHDAILLSVVFRLDAATMALTLKPIPTRNQSKRVTLVAYGCTVFFRPKHQIEAHDLPAQESGVQRIDIEMSRIVMELSAARIERIDEPSATQ